MRRALGVLTMLSVLAGAAAATAADKPRIPYFGSISTEKARMRSGPGRTYPAVWLYVRKDLPVKVIDSFKEWRKIEDPGGTQGWMLATLVSSSRSGIVTGSAPVEMRDVRGGGAVLWRVAPGVVGKVSQCQSGWCRLDVRGRAGFIEAANLWGVEPGETLP